MCKMQINLRPFCLEMHGAQPMIDIGSKVVWFKPR
jgi:hypothetical protein